MQNRKQVPVVVALARSLMRRRPVGVVTSALVVAALVAACDTGSSSDGTASSTPPASSSSEALANPAAEVALAGAGTEGSWYAATVGAVMRC